MFGILHGMLSPCSAVLRCATCLRCVMSGRYFVISPIDTWSSNSKQDGMRSLLQSFSPHVAPADQSTTLSLMGLPFILLNCTQIYHWKNMNLSNNQNIDLPFDGSFSIVFVMFSRWIRLFFVLLCGSGTLCNGHHLSRVLSSWTSETSTGVISSEKDLRSRPMGTQYKVYWRTLPIDLYGHHDIFIWTFKA